MSPAGPPDPLAHTRGRRPVKARFWLWLALETLGRRRVQPLVAARMRGERAGETHGLEHVPDAGPFILAVNHYSGRAAFDTAAAVLHALGRIRPDAIDAMTMIVGRRQPVPKSRAQAMLVAVGRRLLNAIFGRWQAHVIRIPLKNPYPDATGLRAWRARQQPIFVFPEGRARLTFGAVRRGSGRWLAALDMPVVPVGVYWSQAGGWTVRFGAVLCWTPRTDLRDVQLALAMASLLPVDLAPDWQADLARWRAAHQTR